MPVSVGNSTARFWRGAVPAVARLGATLAATNVPGAPGNLSAVVVGGVCQMQFTAPSHSGGLTITEYRVYANGTLLGPPDDASYGDGGFSQARAYSSVSVEDLITVSAVNAVGEGPKSAPVRVS